MKINLAKVISFIGHPLLTIPLYVGIMMFAFEPLPRAIFLSALIVGVLFVPAAMRMYVKSKNGSYTNFDVSDRTQRKSFYRFLIPLLIVVTLILFYTHQSTNLCWTLLFATLLVCTSQIVNLYIKSSLHVSLNIFLSILIMTFDFKIGIVLMLFSLLIGWSRIVLRRHSLVEVLVGGVVGLTVGSVMFYTEGYLF